MAEAFILHRGGVSNSSGSSKPKFIVLTPINSIVTISCGATVRNSNSGTSGSATFGGIDPGTWSFSCITDGVTLTGDNLTVPEEDAQTLYYITIKKNVISAVPSQSGTLTYNGGYQFPNWSNYDSSIMTIGGTTSAIDAGSYTAEFSLHRAYCWPDTTTGSKLVTWAIANKVISTVPSQSGSLTYTGVAQSPSWSNYNSNTMTISGTTSAIDAGSYTATFTPKTNYCWSYGTTGAKSVSWTIGKASGSISLSTTSLSFTDLSVSNTITVSRAGNGSIVASSSNTGIATVSVSGTTVTVTSVADGSATITIYAAAGTNHNRSGSLTCSVSISSNQIPLFTYTGSYSIVDDNNNVITKTSGNWKIRFLTSGTLTFTKLNGASKIDIFAVGGGGSGEVAGGGGGYTSTVRGFSTALNTSYTITVGAGNTSDNTSGSGGTSSAFGVCSAAGGRNGLNDPDHCYPGNGGSGGGYGYHRSADESYQNCVAGPGGTDGSDGGGTYGGNTTTYHNQGIGQHTTTREFGESSGTLYSTGGAGWSNPNNGGYVDGAANTGNGASGWYIDGVSRNSHGGSGIVVIRNAR